MTPVPDRSIYCASDIELYVPGLVGCSDSNCILQRPTGMATNGGCRCQRELLRSADGSIGMNALRTIQFLRGQLVRAQGLLSALETKDLPAP